jgi:beta-lactamase regulating signal transducer with metallopeptidase domain
MMPGMSGLGWSTDWQSLVGVWWEAMGRACLGGALILGGAFVLARLLRRVQAGVRCWIWRLAFLKLFLLFGCFLTISLPVLPARPNSGITTQKGFGIDRTNLAAETRPTSTLGRGAGSGARERPMASAGQSEWAGSLAVLLLGVWCLGALLGLMRLVRQYREAAALVRSASPITDPAIQAEFFQVGRALDLSCRPALLVSDLTDVPLLFGLLRPTIVLPSAVVTSFTPEACRVILAHELAHVKRQDLAWSLLTGLARVLFFFHPLVWWAHRELRTVQEICCDADAIRGASVSAHTYGEVLVRVAANQTASTQDVRIAVAMAESFTTLQRRLEEMQTFRVNAGWKRWTPALVALVGGIALLPWQLEAQTDQKAQADAQLPVQSKEPQRKSGDSRIITVGNYTLRIVDEEIAAPSGPGSQPRMSGYFGNKKFDSNQTCLLDVEGSKDALQLFKGVTNVSSQDDRGKALEVPSESFLFPPSPNRAAVSMNVMLSFEMVKGAKSLKTLQGELVVANAVVRTLTFSADELHSGVSKRSGQVSVTLDDVQHVKARYFVHATITSLQLEPGPGPHLPLGPMTINPDLQVEIFGTNGAAYKTVSTSTTSKVDKSISETVGVNGNLAGANPLILKLDLTFGTEQGVMQPQNLIFHMVEPQGPPFRAPFKFTDIPLAAPH